MGRIHIGTSGWHYKHWRGPFYPEKLSASKMLDFYVRHFDTVELTTASTSCPAWNALQTGGRQLPPAFASR